MVRPAKLRAIGLLALATLLLAPAAAQAGGSGIRLKSNVTKADQVGVRVSLGGFPNERCAATVRKGGRTAKAGATRTSRNGGAVWSWMIPANVGAGTWNFSVRCTGGRHAHRARISFVADRGVGRRSRYLWIRGTLHAHQMIQPRSESGNGGGGSGSLYPAGQCTWWVARQRPDLPFFPGSSGDALNWARSARAHGFPVGAEPKVGSVAIFQPHQYGAGRFGHLALVVAVIGRKMRVSEVGFWAPGRRDERTIGFRGLRFIYKKGNPAPSLSAVLTEPAANDRLYGTVTVAAMSNAPAIRFAAYSYSNPGASGSGQRQVIGEDATPVDGFSTAWDTTRFPNQGGPGQPTVVVSAIVLGADGVPTGASSEVRVAIANSRTNGGQTFFPYYVSGTCQEEECGLPVYSGPGYTKYETVGERQDGEEVDILCQAPGEAFASKFGGTSSIWDKLTGGGWVSDYYVNTPERAVPSPPIPLCP